METLITRADGREDGEEWTENYERLPGGAGISIILESTTREGVGPRLHRHPYGEVWVVVEGVGTFIAGDGTFVAGRGDVVYVPAETPHTFRNTGEVPLKMVCIHEAPRFSTTWLEA